MASQRPETFEQWLSLERTADGGYVSAWPTESNSFNPRDSTGYGGCTMAFGIMVGAASVGSDYRLYSCLGHFIGPAEAGLALAATVTKLRDTRAFATRRIDVFQHRDGRRRDVLCMQADFQRPEPATVLTYSAPPHAEYTAPDESWSELDMRQHAQQQGIDEKILRVFDSAMKARRNYFEVRCPPESYAADTLHGVFPRLGRVQEHKSVTEKTACYYWRCLTPLTSPGANAAALGFLLDAGMPVTGPAYAGLDIARLGTAVSLDFAMRVFANDVDAAAWLAREERTVAAGDGRTFCEARVWDGRGRMVASMSQQCLLRPATRGGASL